MAIPYNIRQSFGSIGIEIVTTNKMTKYMVAIVENKNILFLTTLNPLATQSIMYSIMKIAIYTSRITSRIFYFESDMFVVQNDMLIKNKISKIVVMILYAFEFIKLWVFSLMIFYGGVSFIFGLRRWIVFFIENHILLSFDNRAKPVTWDFIFWKL